MTREQLKAAFAMGGLAGNNAHGAGFLQAALDRGIEPVMISCTSGQILWVSRYLQVRNGRTGTSLREMLRKDIREVNPTGNVNDALATMALFGKPGVFSPAQREYLQDMVNNATDAWNKLTTRCDTRLLAQEWLELFPCRILVPDFPPSFFSTIGEIFHEASSPQGTGATRSPVGIVFNSYNPRSGEEHVYLNDQARRLLHEKSARGENRFDPWRQSDFRDRTTYRNISAEAVRDALWLYQYGFDRKESGFVDGAYFRGLILSELAVADRIFCVRPINHRWRGGLPRNYPELEDLKTEIGFDGAYCGERYQIQLINRLLDRLNAAGDGSYHHIDLQELEIRRPRGYFDYLFESEEVFNDAYEDAIQRFDALGY